MNKKSDPAADAADAGEPKPDAPAPTAPTAVAPKATDPIQEESRRQSGVRTRFETGRHRRKTDA